MAKHPSPAQSVVASLLPSLRERFSSANRALEHLKSLGLGIRRQDFLALWRAGAEAYKQATRIRNVRNDYTPTLSSYGERWFGSPERYTYLVKYQVKNLDTEEVQDRWSYVHTSFRGRKIEIRENATDIIQQVLNRKGSERWRAGLVELSKAWRNPYALPE